MSKLEFTQFGTALFFVRIWRQWLTTNKHKIGENFISSNCYVCLEVNAQSLINIILIIRDNSLLSSDMFLRVLFSSQNCEHIFRTTRSMTSTYSTIINFSTKDIMKRLDRIRTINNIMQDLKEVIVFPREEKRGMKMTLNPTLDLKDVLKSTRELSIIVEDLSACYTAIPLIKSSEDEEDVLIDDRMIDTSNGNSIDANRLQNFTSLPIEETDDDLIDTNSGVRKDLSDISSAGIIDDLVMRSYDDKMADEIIKEGPYVRVTVGNKSKVIKQSSLCWLLEETKNRISADRLKRFLSKSTERPENDKSTGRNSTENATQTSKCKRKYKNRKSKKGKVVKYTCVQSDSSDSSADEF
ncbi:hypothetical protein RN001_000202 [Aquatica leii]|uniref:Uncharacterized protein n=1 Tax=Aquatica leii TaxID=1421715 RepID=A0AAN7PJR8_9COLE|nr:hypothetical protein RN001_000202 [Aquatica leii]